MKTKEDSYLPIKQQQWIIQRLGNAYLLRPRRYLSAFGATTSTVGNLQWYKKVTNVTNYIT